MSGSETGGIGRREVAWRLFAAEFDDATLEYSDSDEERAPNYVITPTGARVNRVVVVGVLTEVESVSEDVLRARVVDPTGAFVVYAGQYQPDAASFLERASPPMYVAVTGKARTFSPEGSDRVFTSIRPESITEVDDGTRDRWTVQAAAHTVDRIAAMAAALDREERGDRLAAVLGEAGLPQGLAAGIPLAMEHYSTTPGYLAGLRRAAVEALQVVTGELDEVTPLDVSPGDAGAADGDLVRPVGVVVDAAALDAIGSVRIEEEEEALAPAGGGGEQPAEPTGAGDGTDDPVDDPEVTTAAGATEVDAPAAEVAGDATPAAGPADDGQVDDDPVDDGPADGDAGGFELDEAEREEIESEFGTEFSAGSEVDAPGEAGIEPEVGVGDEAPGDDPAAPSTADEGSAAGDDDPADAGDDAQAGVEPTDDESVEEPADVDLEAAVVAAMRDLDEGDGAGHDEVVSAVAEAHGVADAAVADAIQDALMSGKCYEPGDDRLKAI